MIRLQDEDNFRLLELFRGERTGFLRAAGCLLPDAYRHFDIGQLRPRSSDVWIVTFPRSGTTWCQELIWMINSGLDYRRALEESLLDRFPFLESFDECYVLVFSSIDFLFHEDLEREIEELNKDNEAVLPLLDSWKESMISKLEKMPGPRHIKTHLPFELLPPDLLDISKVVYVARNPMDVCVSYYHHNRLVRLHDYSGDFPTYWELFKQDEVVYAPYWSHVESGYSRRNHPNLLFLFYEDLKRDLASQIKKVASFLDRPITTEEIDKLCEYLHIENFKKNNTSKITVKGIVNENRGSFIRKGEIGGNKEFTKELVKDAMEWFRENTTRNKMEFPKF